MAGITRKDGGALGRVYAIPDGHGGTIDVPSVTNILGVLNKPALLGWAAREERTMVMEAAAALYGDLAGCPPMPRTAYLTTLEKRVGQTKAYAKTQAKAQEIGSQAHALVEWDLHRRMGRVPGPEPESTEPARHAFAQWAAWADRVKLEPLAVEQMVYSRTEGYAGTLDLLARVDGRLAVLDWKTSSKAALYPEYRLQNIAYRHAVREMGHGDPVTGYVVRLPKTPDADGVVPMEVLDAEADLLPVLRALMMAWQFQAANERAYQAKRKAAA